MSYRECGRDAMDEFDYTFNNTHEAIEFIHKDIMNTNFVAIIEISPQCSTYLDLPEIEIECYKKIS